MIAAFDRRRVAWALIVDLAPRCRLFRNSHPGVW